MSKSDFQDQIIAKLNACAPDNMDDGTWEVGRTSESVLAQIKYVLTTGITAFDAIVGGMPFGRMIELFGLEGCGKSAMAIRCAARAHLGHICEVIHSDDDKMPTFKPLDPKDCDVAVFYVDNEQSLDDDEKIVYDGKQLDIVNFRCDTTDQMFKAIDRVIDVAEARTEKSPKKHHFLVIVVDTIASTTTKQEMEQVWGTQDYPRQAAQISKALRLLTRRVNRFNVCLLFTNQVRSSFEQKAKGKKVVFGINPLDYKSIGGFALRFHASHRVFMYAQPHKYKLVPDAQFPAGIQIGFHTVKNRLRMPLRDGRMALLFDKKQGGLNDAFSLLETLIFLGFIELKKEKGSDFVCKFARNGIVPTTFDPAAIDKTLDEEDEDPTPRRGSRKDPGFKYRALWPQFYRDHKADVDKLWDRAVAYAMSTDGLDGSVVVQESDELIDEDEKD